MNYFILFVVSLHYSFSCFSQTASDAIAVDKLPIDSMAIANWSDLMFSQASVSPDGKYFTYTIDNFPVGSNTLVVQSTDNGWKKEFIGAYSGLFSYDSKQLILQLSDTLYFISLGSSKQTYVSGVSYFTYPKTIENNFNTNSRKVIAYKLKRSNDVVVKDLVNNQEYRIDSVSDFLLNASGSLLLVKKRSSISETETLVCIDIRNRQIQTIWNNSGNIKNVSLHGYQFDAAGSQIVILIEDKNSHQNTIWYYKPGMNQAEIKASDNTLTGYPRMHISNQVPFFSKNGNFIFFKVLRHPEPQIQPDPKAVHVDVWNYKDLILQSLQAHYRSKNEEVPQHLIKTQFIAAVGVQGGNVRQLEDDSTTLKSDKTTFVGDFVITSSYENKGDKTWKIKEKNPYFITSVIDGTRKYVGTLDPRTRFWPSPSRKYIVYFDVELKHYMSYDLLNGSIKNISKPISVKLTKDELDEFNDPNVAPAGVAGWLENTFLLIYDNYDLWLLDPSGSNSPKNLTNGYGRLKNVKFDLIPDVGESDENTIYSIKKPLFLTGFCQNTKQTGFYQLDINNAGDPNLLSLHSSQVYATVNQTNGAGLEVTKVKADITNRWIVKKQTVADAPNFFFTTDFKKFRRLTNLQPQKKYRWVTSELLSWKMSDGKVCQGVLYKPEDFDKNRKYPTILRYYENESATLHQFLRPAFVGNELNVAWFVSRGYLIFMPDIHYTVGNVSRSVVNSIVSGVHELLKLPFVDSSAIGIQGHSFGGYETNVLITETTLFAAAAEGAGASDLISQYGSLLPEGRNNGTGVMHQEMGGQHRMKGLLWENQQGYIENSPIFKVDKVTTPLLIMHNKGDQAVPWGQAVEMFIALRRLNKPVWMLQYDGEGHGVGSSKNQQDFTTRMTQFFDHYLKHTPAPKWMTQGIPLSQKGILTGYGLDPSGSCGIPGGHTCGICSNWNKQYAEMPGIFLKPENEWHLGSAAK